MPKIITSILFWLLLTDLAMAQKGGAKATPGSRLTAINQAAQTFLQALTPAQKHQATFNFADTERFNWHYVPKERKGLSLKEMSLQQRKLAFDLLQIPLSQEGYNKARAIMELEVVLKALENLPPENNYRDPDKYYFTIFGQPDGPEPWGWRIEGHHLSLNFSSATNQVVSQTPAFMGSNPAIVLQGPEKGKQILKQEAELGFSLVNAFSDEQLKQVIIAERGPNEILTSNTRRATLEKFSGLPYPAMNASQQKLINQLLALYLNNYKPALAQVLRQKINKAGLDHLYFAWAGSREPGPGNAHYYRIHSPVILIEYDNSQNNANHVHTVIRDLTNDFGEDALQAHYQKHKHQK